MSDKVRVVEVGPRDGLQNEPSHASTAVKVELIGRLFAAGLRSVEAGAFVSPKWVPQMADTADVLAALTPPIDAELMALVPNEKGLAPALHGGIGTVAVFVAASETFSRRNTNCSIAESLQRIVPVIDGAHAAGRRVRGYVSCIVGCPYEGTILPTAVAAVVDGLVAAGCDEISLGDTVGVARPKEIDAVLDAVLPSVAVERLAIHAHDTYGMGIANVLRCIERGLRNVDASVAGLGGCPYAPGASGNVATEDVVYLFQSLGLQTGIDLDQLAATGAWISQQLGRANGSRAGAAVARTAFQRSA
jgi:hydroxymethylglutaryl-CoA lyase